jgi:hypothetical protein
MEAFCSLPELLSRPEVVVWYRDLSPDVYERFFSPVTIKNLCQLLATSDSRPTLETIHRLFLSPNTSLLEDLFSSADLTLSLLSVMNSGSGLRTGYAATIIESGFRHFPVDLLTAFNMIPQSFPTLLAHVHEEPIFALFHTVIGLVPASSATFLWGFIRVLIPPSHGLTLPDDLPPGVVACASVRLQPPAKLRVLELLRTAARTFSDDSPFRAALLEAAPHFADISASVVFGMGLALPPSPALVQQALGLMGAKTTPPRDLEAAVRYLAYGYDGARIEPVVNFLYRILRSSSTNSFVLQAGAALVAATFERATYPRFFAKVVQHCVARAWNRKPKLRSKLLYRAIVIDIATAVGDTPSWAGWEEFDRTVLRPYANRNEFPHDFLIPEADWDKALVDRIKTQPETLERTVIDRKPSSGDIMDFLVGEDCIVDDPREALPGEPASDHYEDYDILVVQVSSRRKSRRRRSSDDCAVA